MQAPSRLEKTQRWFASIISRPIDTNSNMDLTSPSGLPMEIEAAEYILPSPTLSPEKRIELYNQQYWWRLLSILQEDFPLVVRLFGYEEFNQKIATPYLVKYPPRHWTLDKLGDRLVQWLGEEYHASDQALIYHAATIDAAFHDSFTAANHTPITMDDLEKTLYLQPHIHLFSLPYDLFTCRREFLKEDPEYWIEHDFPKLPKGEDHFFILFRNPYNDSKWKSISFEEFSLLKQFQQGATLDSLCEWMEENGGSEESFQKRLSAFTTSHWLTTHVSS